MVSPSEKAAPSIDPARQNNVLLRAVKVVVVSLGVTLALLVTALTLTVMDLHNTRALLISGHTSAAQDAEAAARSATSIHEIVTQVETQLLQIEHYGGDVTIQLCNIEQNWLSYSHEVHFRTTEPNSVKAICSPLSASEGHRTP